MTMQNQETKLWTEPYTDEKYGKEKGASFKYFKQFIRMPKPRTLVNFHEALSNQMSNDGRKRIPSYQTIKEYSCKWHWMERSKAYDEYQDHIHDEEMQEKIRQIRESAIAMMKERFDYHQELQEELKKDWELNTNQKLYGFAKNSEGLKNDVASFNELVNEGKTKLDASVDADVKQEVHKETKNVHTIFDEVDKQLGLDGDVTGAEGYSDNEER